MKFQLSHQTKRFLVSLHVICAIGWAGSVLVVLFMLTSNKNAPPALSYAVANLCKQIDDQLIIPFAMLSLLTGLALCAITPWGFVKHWWVVVKGLMTAYFIIFGTIALGPWLNKSAEIATAAAHAPLTQQASVADPLYKQLSDLLSAGVPPQFFLLLFVVVISYVRPWGVTPWHRK